MEAENVNPDCSCQGLGAGGTRELLSESQGSGVLGEHILETC